MTDTHPEADVNGPACDCHSTVVGQHVPGCAALFDTQEALPSAEEVAQKVAGDCLAHGYGIHGWETKRLEHLVAKAITARDEMWEKTRDYWQRIAESRQDTIDTMNEIIGRTRNFADAGWEDSTKKQATIDRLRSALELIVSLIENHTQHINKGDFLNADESKMLTLRVKAEKALEHSSPAEGICKPGSVVHPEALDEGVPPAGDPGTIGVSCDFPTGELTFYKNGEAIGDPHFLKTDQSWVGPDESAVDRICNKCGSYPCNCPPNTGRPITAEAEAVLVAAVAHTREYDNQAYCGNKYSHIPMRTETVLFEKVRAMQEKK